MQREGSAITLAMVERVLNSRIAALIYQGLYGGLALAGGYLRFGTPQVSAFPLPQGIDNYDEDISEQELAHLYGVDALEVETVFRSVFGETPDVIEINVEGR
jgi:hypothetical protein